MLTQSIIMNHHSRDASPIIDKIQKQGRSPIVFTDPTSYGKDKKNKLRYLGLANNYLNILEAPTEAKWKIIMHDDISVPEGLMDKIDYILERAPSGIISFYNPNNKAYQEAYANGNHVLATYKNTWLQVHAIPTQTGFEIAKWIREKCYPLGLRSEDGMIWSWSTVTKNRIHAIIPSLIQHDGYAKSTFGNPAKAGKYYRYSATYRPQFDVKTIDWEYEFNNPFLNLVGESNLEGFTL